MAQKSLGELAVELKLQLDQLKKGQAEVKAELKKMDKGFADSEKKMRDTEKQSQKTGIAFKKTARNLKDTGKAAKEAEFGFSSLGKTIKTAAAASIAFGLTGAIAGLPQKLKRISDEFVRMQNLIGTISSADGISNISDQVFELANNARVGVSEFTTLFTRIQRAISQFGGTMGESLKITDTISKGLILAGAASNEANSAMLQLSQAFNKGKLDGDEFRTVMELMPNVMQAVADKLGVAKGELIELAPQGEITSQILKDAILESADSIDASFKKITPTIEQSFDVMRNKTIQAVGNFNEASHASEGFSKLILALADAIGFLGDHIEEIIVLIGGYSATLVASSLKAGALSKAILALNVSFGMSSVAAAGATTKLVAANTAATASIFSFKGLAVAAGKVRLAMMAIAASIPGLNLLIGTLAAGSAILVKTNKEIAKSFDKATEAAQRFSEQIDKYHKKNVEKWDDLALTAKKRFMEIQDAQGEVNMDEFRKEISETMGLSGASLDSFIQRMQKIPNEVVKSTSSISALTDEIKELETQINVSEIGSKRFNDLAKQLKQAKKNLQNAKGEFSTSSTGLASLESPNKSGDELVKKIQKRYSKILKTRKGFFDEIAELLEREKSLTDENTEAVSDEMQAILDLKKEHKNAIDDMIDDISELNIEVEKLISGYEEAKTKSNEAFGKDIARDLTDYKEDLKEINKEINDLLLEQSSLTGQDDDSYNKRRKNAKKINELYEEQNEIARNISDAESFTTEEEKAEAEEYAELSDVGKKAADHQEELKNLEEVKNKELEILNERKVIMEAFRDGELDKLQEINDAENELFADQLIEKQNQYEEDLNNLENKLEREVEVNKKMLLDVQRATRATTKALTKMWNDVASAKRSAAGYAEGGLVQAFASGGLVRGAGTATSDSIPARLSNGEFVMNAAATRKFLPLLENLNSVPSRSSQSVQNISNDNRTFNVPVNDISNPFAFAQQAGWFFSRF